MSKNRFYAIFGAIAAVCALSMSLLRADTSTSASKPVYILLYSRFYDHSHEYAMNERVIRLLQLVQKLHDRYPQYRLSALMQFSGTTSQILADENATMHLVDKIKDFAARGLVEVGYTGEDEPSYLYRPWPNVLLAETPEQRWTAIAQAHRHFLTDFKDPVTGQPFPGLSGGLKRTQEVFGPVAFISGLTQAVSGDEEAVHEVDALNDNAVLTGIRPADPRLGIEGYSASASMFSKMMSPDLNSSPEVYWEDGRLRVSDTTLPDNKIRSLDKKLDDFKKSFAQLDRSRPRVLKIEVADYLRYLTKRPDGSVRWDPMEWLYYHPENPQIPGNIKALNDQFDVEKGWQNEATVLDWLLTTFLPANQGSRFVSVGDLKSMADDPLGSNVTAAELHDAAADLVARFKEQPMSLPNFARAGDKFFSLADSFELLSQALAIYDHQGSLPDSLKLTRIYGPLVLPNDMGPVTGTFTVSDVLQAATQVAARIRKEAWKEVPDNAVPASVNVANVQVTCGQFLRLLAEAYLDPTKDKTLKLNRIQPFSSAAFMYPKNTANIDQGNIWTFRPAVLRVSAAGAAAASN
jgi:hypothetical protein